MRAGGGGGGGGGGGMLLWKILKSEIQSMETHVFHSSVLHIQGHSGMCSHQHFLRIFLQTGMESCGTFARL